MNECTVVTELIERLKKHPRNVIPRPPYSNAECSGWGPLTWAPDTDVEAILSRSGARIEHVENHVAQYDTTLDKIFMPDLRQFSSADRYYRVALHELAHWSGHKSRLDRFKILLWDDEDGMEPAEEQPWYAEEEVRAEIAMLMVCTTLSLEYCTSPSMEYLATYFFTLGENGFYLAAQDAEKIATFLLSFSLVSDKTAKGITYIDKPPTAFEQAEYKYESEQRDALFSRAKLVPWVPTD